MNITAEEYEQILRSFAATIAKEYIRLYDQKPNVAWVERFSEDITNDFVDQCGIRVG